MKTLILVRHAKSSWDNPELSDKDRPLNDRGLKDAPAMGRHLKSLSVFPDLIISSPANRAYTTARLVSKELAYSIEKIKIDERIYFGTFRNLLNIIADTDDSVNTLMMFGHNPDTQMLASFLTENEFPNYPTAAAACIDFVMDSWKEIIGLNGVLRFFEYPKKLNK